MIDKSQKSSGREPLGQQVGLTMVELLVALTLSGLIALAAIAALTVARTGFTTVDGASQLRDNARFSADLIQRVAAQAGYQDFERANQTKANEIRTAGPSGTASMPEPFVRGLNNMLAVSSDPRTGRARTAANDGCPSNDLSACVNGSDILILRYQTQPLLSSSTSSDNAMIDCMGQAITSVPSATDLRNFAVINVFHVQRSSSGEPALMCSRGTTDASFPTGTAQPIVQGVESFQVLYGLAPELPASSSPASRVASDAGRYDLPERYLNAQQLGALTLPSGVADAGYWWRQVRSLRIALLMRGPPGNAQSRATEMFPMLAASNALDAGSLIQFTDGTPPTDTSNYIFPHDGRQRQLTTFTVYLRNDQAPLNQQ